ncbi:hypothetical protein CTI12_AA404950 [Artemisia annua]|uniref:Reverse transcriptase domain-containing protein n=1 Tax=Artemisia annua TaxID=35608 RepID=A0A2U1MA34_ARTAN|nr:hypothetical protein CTI12_AA404950 [Artemisia annua]
MKFAVVRSPYPYNIILGRSGIKELRVMPSTIHAMMKFPTPRGVATLVTWSVIISECRKLEEKFLLEKEVEVEVPPVVAVMSEVTKTEEILVHPAYPDQLVTIGRNLSPEVGDKDRNVEPCVTKCDTTRTFGYGDVVNGLLDVFGIYVDEKYSMVL